jgi:tagaturonate reductase
LQYGEGNFLRAFVDHMIDIANEKEVFSGSVQLVKPIASGNLEAFHAQDCIYTVLLRGQAEGKATEEKRVVRHVAGISDPYGDYEEYASHAKNPELRIIISNTTEAGIAFDDSDRIELKPPKSYPGKLTKLLYERFMFFEGSSDKGLIMLPVELIEKNGANLKDCCLKLAALWELPQEFISWLSQNCVFCNTVVDRIVTGYPKDEVSSLEKEFGYTDKLMTTGEPFGLWVIASKCPETIAAEFPLDKAGLPVIFTSDLRPYRERKVRILNGAHTASVLAAYLSGLDSIGELMKDSTMRSYIERAVYDELVPMVPLPAAEVKQFADSVMERFGNPFIKHDLLAIALNSVSKFKARLLPTIIETQERKGKLPELLCFSLAALIAFYSGKPDPVGRLIAIRNGIAYEIMDDPSVLKFFADSYTLSADMIVSSLLRRTDFWGTDLTQIIGLAEVVTEDLQNIRKYGMRAAVEKMLIVR